jgi:hypothetical protein
MADLIFMNEYSARQSYYYDTAILPYRLKEGNFKKVDATRQRFLLTFKLVSIIYLIYLF